MKKIILIFISWRIFTLLALVAGLALPIQTSYLGGGVKNYFLNPLIWAWANFDGVHYLSIATGRYGQFEQPFFPLYPLLINFLSSLSHLSSEVVGLLISQASFILGLFFLYKLLNLDLTKKETVWVCLFLIFFPASFFFGAVYTESLFFLFSVVCFYAARKRIWWLSGISGALASATRLIGVFLFPAILVEYFICHPRDRKWLWLLLIPIGLFLYMIWLQKTYGDALYFYHAHSYFNAGRTSSRLILLPQVIFRYLKIFVTVKFSYTYVISVFEFIISIAALVLSIYSFKILRLSYFIYAFFSYLVPTMSGTFLSLPRIVLVVFPLFMVLVKIVKKDSYKVFVLGAFAVLLFLATMLFTRGYWIS